MLKKARNGMGLPMWIACILLCLVLLTVYLSKDLYAKYATGDRSGMEARVAGYGALTLTETGDFSPGTAAIVLPGVNLTKRAVIDFEGGEVSSYVYAEITLSGHWTTTDQRTFTVKSGTKTLLSWTVESEWQYLTTTAGGTYVFYQKLNANEELHADLIANGGLITVSNAMTAAEVATLSNAFIHLRATAVQANGFKTPDAAWASVAG